METRSDTRLEAWKLLDEAYRDGVKLGSRDIMVKIPAIKSTSTAHGHITSWKRNRKEQVSKLRDSLNVSDDFLNALVDEVSRLSIQAQEEYANSEAEALAQADDAIRDLADMEKQYAQLASEVKLKEDAWSADIKQKNQKIRELEDKVGGLSQEKETTEKELRQQLEEQKQTCKTLISTNENLRTEVAKAQLIVENNQQYVTEAKDNVKQIQTELKAAYTHISDLKTELATNKQESKSTAKDLENLQTSLKDERNNVKLINQSLSDVNNKLLKTEATNSSLDEKYSLVKDELTRLQIRESEMNTSLAESKVALIQASKDIETIRTEKNLLGTELDKAMKTISSQERQINELNNIQERLNKLEERKSK